MSRPKLSAALPAAIRRRWDRLAAVQLAERALQLESENDELRSELSRAEQNAEHWYENAMELAGEQAGLTVDGRLVRGAAA